MVSLKEVKASNDRISSTLSGLVAVFVGGTSGIGEYTLTEFARHVVRPRVYLVGRSQDAADRILAECRVFCPDGTFTFMQADVSLLRVTDDVCREIRSKEKAINLLCLSQGTLIFDKETEEEFNYAIALSHYSRARFIVNLLPLIKQAKDLRRVVTTLAGGKEGKLYTDDLDGRKVPIYAGRGHLASLKTTFLEAMAREAPEVSFIHNFPGFVKGGAARGTTGIIWGVLKGVFALATPLLAMDNNECGERHLFLATSARYPPRVNADTPASGVPLSDTVTIAAGADGQPGSGAYTIESDGESAGPKVMALLADLRRDSAPDYVLQHTRTEFKRVTGLEEIQT